ncbi:MAG: efflux RND transporter periplasmic adaptor subunit, partial [bacterium]
MPANNFPFGLVNRKSVGLVILSLGIIGGLSYATINNRLKGGASLEMPTYEVQQGPLTISIIYAGTIQARDKEVIKSELEGQNAILYIAPDGARVKKGDLLLELDTSTLKDELIDQQIKVQNAEAAFINARENFEVVKSQAQSDIDKAVLTYSFAKLDLEKYEQGDYPKSEKEALSNIQQQQEALNLAKQDVKWSQILFDQKYLAQSELDNDKLAATRAAIQTESAKDALKLLKEFTSKRQMAQLSSDVKEASMALERTQRKANANIVQASAELQAKESELERQNSKLKKLEGQIEKAVVRAEMDSVVVYASQSRGFRGNEEPLREGTLVRERQELIYLPTTSSYKADLKIHESVLDKIRINSPVRITIEALPGKVFTGHVATIAPLPDQQSMFMNPDLKVYNTEVYIDGNGDGLRSGMTCEAEIIIDQFDDALYIPVHTVLLIGGKPSVYIAKGDTMEVRTVEIGPDNNRLIQIKSGLQKGEKVVLNPPLASAELDDGTNKEKFNLPAKTGDMAAPAGGQPAAPGTQPGSGPGAGPSIQPQDGGMGAPDTTGGEMRRGGRNRQGGAGEAGPGFGPGGPGEGQPGMGGRPDMQNMTDEQREQMRQR